VNVTLASGTLQFAVTNSELSDWFRKPNSEGELIQIGDQRNRFRWRSKVLPQLIVDSLCADPEMRKQLEILRWANGTSE
jgi:hypothetical protein